MRWILTNVCVVACWKTRRSSQRMVHWTCLRGVIQKSLRIYNPDDTVNFRTAAFFAVSYTMFTGLWSIFLFVLVFSTPRKVSLAVAVRLLVLKEEMAASCTLRGPQGRLHHSAPKGPILLYFFTFCRRAQIVRESAAHINWKKIAASSSLEKQGMIVFCEKSAQRRNKVLSDINLKVVINPLMSSEQLGVFTQDKNTITLFSDSIMWLWGLHNW